MEALQFGDKAASTKLERVTATEALQLFSVVALKCDYIKTRANSRELLWYLLGVLGDDHPELSDLIRSCISRDFKFDEDF